MPRFRHEHLGFIFQSHNLVLSWEGLTVGIQVGRDAVVGPKPGAPIL